ncbi:MAG: precorrin-3B C(17)-methyltransferase, partial [Pseudomonadota bacterium]
MSETPAIIILSDHALDLAARLQDMTGGSVDGLSGRVSGQTDSVFDDVKTAVQAAFTAKRPIIAVMASGALIRLLAPVLNDKRNEPPVICVAEDGSAVVPLLGGHHGANELAKQIAAELGIAAAITTAGDLRFGVALDRPPAGYVLANPEHAKIFMADLLAGASVKIEGEAPWLADATLTQADDARHRMVVCDKINAGDASTL